MAMFADQKVYLDKALRKAAEAIFGKLPHGVGFQWTVGDEHPEDPDASKNSAQINEALKAADIAASEGEKIVVVLDS